MLASFKTVIKNVGDSAVETLVRPPVQTTATKEVNKFLEKGIDDLPINIRKLLDTIDIEADVVDNLKHTKKTKTSKFTKLAVNQILRNNEKLDKFLVEFVNDLRPVMTELLNGADVEFTEYVIEEIKISLHIIKKEGEFLDMEMRDWPKIETVDEEAELIEKIGYSVHRKIRKISVRLLPKILSIIPEVLKKATSALVTANLKESFAENEIGISFIDKIVDKLEDITITAHDKATKDVVELLWSGIDETVHEQLMKHLVEMENNLVLTAKQKVAILPGI